MILLPPPGSGDYDKQRAALWRGGGGGGGHNRFLNAAQVAGSGGCWELDRDWAHTIVVLLRKEGIAPQMTKIFIWKPFPLDVGTRNRGKGIHEPTAGALFIRSRSTSRVANIPCMQV